MIIAVSGKARSGKGEFAVVAKDYQIKELAFASGVKEELSELLSEVGISFEHRHFWGTTEDKSEILKVDSTTKKYLLDHDFWSFLYTRASIRYDEHGQQFLFTPRALMQWWGTEYRRILQEQENYWVDRLFAKLTPEMNCVITDLRFKNEARRLRELGAILIRVDRPDRPTICGMDHPTEVDLDDWGDWDYMISNEGSLVDYHKACRIVIEDIL